MLTQPPRCHRGVTLVEIIVTLAILGMMILATLPSIGSWLRNSQIRSAAEAIQNGLGKARSEAVRRNTPVRFSLVTNTANAGKLDNNCALSSSSASWVVSLDSPEGACAAAVNDSTSPKILDKWARGESAANVTVSAVQPNSDGSCSTTTATQVTFNGFGRVSSGSTSLGCINVDNSTGSGNRALRLVIGPQGAVRLCDPAVTDSNDPRSC
jgi:type IV fimbrial biogenesis protein FimT